MPRSGRSAPSNLPRAPRPRRARPNTVDPAPTPPRDRDEGGTRERPEESPAPIIQSSAPIIQTEGIEPFDALPYFEHEFRATGNPAYAWAAIRIIIPAELAFPEWVLTYLDETAARIHELSHHAPADPARAVFQAIGFTAKQKRNPFRGLADDSHDHLIAFEMWIRLSNREKYESALVSTAEAHPVACVNDPKCESLSAASVARCWRAYRSRFAPIPKDRKELHGHNSADR